MTHAAVFATGLPLIMAVTVAQLAWHRWHLGRFDRRIRRAQRRKWGDSA